MGRSERSLRLLVAAFGDPGHAFPAIALARELAGRGHEVLVETWERWREAVESEGLEFTGAQEYTVYPPPGPDTPDGQTAAAAARALARLMEGFEPDLVVSDILTLAPTLAAEVADVPHATLIPHVYPVQQPGMPLYSLGLRPRLALRWVGSGGGRRGRCWRWGCGRVATSSTRQGRGWGSGRSSGFTAGSASCWQPSGRSLSWSIRGSGRRTYGSRGRCSSSFQARRWRFRRAMGRWCWSRPVLPRTRNAS